MEKLIGREVEKGILREALDSPSPELLALFGRRRVGKTFLVRQYYAGNLAFEFTGTFY
jgi:AAA+ ATPase superfamily predicted ATPase